MKNTILLLLSFTMVSCAYEETPKATINFECPSFKKSNENLNINILLDLSDRIELKTKTPPNKTMEYSQRDRDIGYITSIVESFRCHIANKKSRKMNDNIKIFIEPESNIPELNSISTALNLKFNKDNTTIPKINSISKVYQKNIAKIYKTATKQKKYDGSDIWEFFNSKINNCIKDNHKNILIILTDGYLYDKTKIKLKLGNKTANFTTETIKKHQLNKHNWKKNLTKKNIGILPTDNKNLENLKIMVIGLNPKKSCKNPYELHVMKLLWENWLEEMGISKYSIKTADLPSNLDENIKNFIAN